MTRQAGQRAGLSRRQVLDAARQLLAEEGLDRLTIRSLAQRLGVAPNAVYGWVDSKAALLDTLVDDSLRGVTVRRDTGSPIESLRSLLLDAYVALVASPELAPLYLSRRDSPGPAATAFREGVQQLLLEAGLPVRTVDAAVPVLVVHTLGFAAFVQRTDGQARLLHRGPERAPADMFAQGIDWLLAGVQSSDAPPADMPGNTPGASALTEPTNPETGR